MAGIAKEAIAHGPFLRRPPSGAPHQRLLTSSPPPPAAKENAFDVVLIDTAGRMQDNSPLMKSLSKLVSTNNPDKIVFVGEALVGNEAVDQLTKFDRSLREGTRETSGGRGGKGGERGIEGIVLTKFDTIVRARRWSSSRALRSADPRDTSLWTGRQGWRRAVDDLRHRPAHSLCRLRPGA